MKYGAVDAGADDRRIKDVGSLMKWATGVGHGEKFDRELVPVHALRECGKR